MARKTSERNTAPNLSGLYAVSYREALRGGKPREGVYGVVTRDTPFITKPKAKPGSNSQHLRDLTDSSVPTVLKNRILAFWDNPNNDQKDVCFLVEKPIYDEMRAMQQSSTGGPRTMSGSSQAVKKPARRTTKGGF